MFMTLNGLLHWNDQKYKTEDQIRLDFPAIQRDFLAGEFPADTEEQLRSLLKEVGNRPLIVRSSSLYRVGGRRLTVVGRATHRIRRALPVG